MLSCQHKLLGSVGRRHAICVKEVALPDEGGPAHRIDDRIACMNCMYGTPEFTKAQGIGTTTSETTTLIQVKRRYILPRHNVHGSFRPL